MLKLKVSDRVQATPAYQCLMPHIFPSMYQKLNENTITFPLRIPMPIQSKLHLRTNKI